MKKRLIACFLALGFSFVQMAAVASAATAAPAQVGPGGQGLEISPPLITLDTDPGKKVTFTIKVRNVTKVTVETTSEIDDFVAVGELGQSKVQLDKNAPLSPYSFKPWAESIPAVELAAGQQKPVTVTLDVPKDASPGGHYGVVRFSATEPGLDGTGVSLTASIGTLVLMNVSGKVTNKASLASFYTVDKTGKKRSFFNSGPVSFVERVQNQGNLFFSPLGTIRVTSTFGGQVGVITVNQVGGNVLPDSIRRFQQQFNKSHMFGRYKAEVNLTYDGKNLNQTITFWVIPLKQVGLVLAAIIVLFVFIRVNTRRAVKKATRKASSSSSSVAKKKKK